MGRLHLLETEELLLRFRPHPLSYSLRYAASFLWLVPGALAVFLSPQLGNKTAAAGAFLCAIIAVIAALVAWKTPRLRLGFPLFAAAFFILGGSLMLVPGVELPGLEAWYGLALSILVTLIRLALHEADRLSRVHYLTTQRLVIQGGLRGRSERTMLVEKVIESRTTRGVLGQLFDYGDITLVLAKRMKREGGSVEDVETLRGVGALSDLKHNVDQLLAESKLPPRDRRKRLEERRVKESMRLLANWMRTERARGRT